MAVCRTFGIPARIEVSTKKPQYLEKGIWTDANFDKPEPAVTQKGEITFINACTKKDFVPAYYIHYTIAVLKDGKYHTLDYEGAPEVSKFPFSLELDTGKYILVTGNRKPDGTVLASIRFFDLAAGQKMKLPVKLRETPAVREILGVVDLKRKLKFAKSAEFMNVSEISSGKGCILLWIDPDKEPTKHLIAELEQLKGIFEKWGGGMLFLLSQKYALAWDEKKYSGLPKQKLILLDDNYSFLADLETAVKRDLQGDLPAIAIVNPQGEVVFVGSGYRIGTGEQLAKAVQ